MTNLILPEVINALKRAPRTWLVTGAAGFIGGHLVENLLRLDQHVVGLDNLATGHVSNLEDIRQCVSAEQWQRFVFMEDDIRDLDACRGALQWRSVDGRSRSVDIVLHQAALGSVPRSIADPVATHTTNTTGFLNVLLAAQEQGVQRLVFAGSSSTYGDSPSLPKVEDVIGRPLSPYAVTKYSNELYAAVFGDVYGIETIGLRYFNVFGPRQDPDGAYAAVIPKWIAALLQGETVYINGDGETSRDFCYVGNVVQANLRAALSDDRQAIHQVFNVAVGEQTTLNQLFETLRAGLSGRFPHVADSVKVHRDFREGDVRHSLADITKARSILGYRPSHSASEGLELTLEWFADRYAAGR